MRRAFGNAAKKDVDLNVATEDQARTIAGEIEKLLTSLNVWYTITEKRSPKLRYIVFSDISIKVNDGGKNDRP